MMLLIATVLVVAGLTLLGAFLDALESSLRESS